MSYDTQGNSKLGNWTRRLHDFFVLREGQCSRTRPECRTKKAWESQRSPKPSFGFSWVSIWIAAARPKTLIASISPILMGASLGASGVHWSWGWFACILCTGLGIQVGTNLVNDYFDYVKGADSAQRKGPLRVTAAGLVSQESMRRAIAWTWMLTIAMGALLVYRGGMVFALLLASAVLLGFLYTAGPYPIAYLGLGECFVFPFFGPVATASTHFLLTRTFSWVAVIAGVSPGLLATALLIVNNVRDVVEDRNAGKCTLVVRFGHRFGVWEYTIAIWCAMLAPMLLCVQSPKVLLVLLAFVVAIPLVRHMQKRDAPYNEILAKTGQLFWVYTLLFCAGVLL